MKITVESKSGDVRLRLRRPGNVTSMPACARDLIFLMNVRPGTCGTCRARVMSGDVEVRWKEAPGAQEAQAREGRRADVPDAAHFGLRAARAVRHRRSLRNPPAPRRGVIRNIRKLTSDVAHFELHLSAPMDFEAGQFVVSKRRDLTGGRAYSMVNFEHAAGQIALVIKRKPGGRFSDWLFDARRREKPDVDVFGPLGRAVFRPDEDENIICIAGGSGIAGMMAILEHAVQVDHFRHHKGDVFFGVRTLADLSILRCLRAMSRIRTAISRSRSRSRMKPECVQLIPIFRSLKLANGMVHDVAAHADGRPL